MAYLCQSHQHLKHSCSLELCAEGAGTGQSLNQKRRVQSRAMNIVLDLLFLLIIIIYSYLESLVKVFIPRRRKSVAGEIVLVTGAGHGIGRKMGWILQAKIWSSAGTQPAPHLGHKEQANTCHYNRPQMSEPVYAWESGRSLWRR